MPAFGIAHSSAGANNPIEVTTFGVIGNLNTSAYAEGTQLFVATTAGAVTDDPTGGESVSIQKIGRVTRSHASVGSIFVMGAGRSN